jgi:hypothetical protein
MLATATTTVASNAKMNGSGSQRSVHAVLASASLATGPGDPADLKFSMANQSLPNPA